MGDTTGISTNKRSLCFSISYPQLFLSRVRSELMPLVCLAVLWIIMIVIARPVGNFPLNDDWCYASTVKTLIEKGKLEFAPYSAPAYFGLVLWGALFCLPFGFSFMALRVSCLVLSLSGVWALYGLLREMGISRALAFLGSAVLLANPLYFVQSVVFMTDAPFTALVAWVAFLFIRGLRTRSWVTIALAAVACCAATATRQFGLLLPLAFLVAYIWKVGFSRRAFFIAFAPTAVTALAFVLCPNAVQGVARMFTLGGSVAAVSEPFYRQVLREPVFYLKNIGQGALSAAIMLGLYCLPMLIVVPWWRIATGVSVQSKNGDKSPGYKYKKRRHTHSSSVSCRYISLRNIRSLDRRQVWRVMLAITLLASFLTIFILLRDQLSIPGPRSGNVLCHCGLGPQTLRDTYITFQTTLPGVHPGIWKITTWTAFVCGSIVLCFLLWSLGRIVQYIFMRFRILEDAISVFLLASIIFLYVPISIILAPLPFTDRYVLPCLPLLIAMFVRTYVTKCRLGMVRTVFASLLLLVFCAFGVAGTHDYLAWNRARWEALNWLMHHQKVDPRDIDGGFEFNGWYTFSVDYQRTPHKSWWWVENDAYLVTFRVVPEARLLKAFPYERWMPRRQKDYIYVGKTIDAWSAPPGADWTVKPNPYVDRVVACEDVSEADVAPVGVSTVFPDSAKQVLLLVRVKPFKSDVHLAYSVFRDGGQPFRTNSIARPQSLSWLAIRVGENERLPTGSYTAILEAEGMKVARVSFKIVPAR